MGAENLVACAVADACAVASPWGPAVLHWAAGERLEALQALLRGGTSPEAASGTTGSGGSEHELVVDFLRHSSSSLSAVRLWQGKSLKRDNEGLERREMEYMSTY